MALWLQGAVDEIGCEGQGCPSCPYQIFMEEESWACVGEKYWDNYDKASELWRLVGQSKKGDRLQDIIGEMEKDEEDVWIMSLSQIKETVSLFSGLESALYEFTGNKRFRFHPNKIDWDMNQYSDLIDHWKNSDGTEVYTLANSLYRVRDIEHYLKGALRVGKPVQFEG